jgi:superfamily II DNA/RNA helicase
LKPAANFSDFQLSPPLSDVLIKIGYKTPTPVQAQAIPLILEGKDVLATAQTGTGKTAAFVLPLLSKILAGERKRVLIVAPTRELAEQIGRVLEELTSMSPNVKACVIIGGLAYQNQIRALRENPAFVVGTPGRLLDQIEMGHLKLQEFTTLVMDEADRMLDMGFEPQMKSIVSHLPSERQSLLFSATFPNAIQRLAHSFLYQPVRVEIGVTTKPVEAIVQDVVYTTGPEKDKTLIKEIDRLAGSIIVFTRTKFRTEHVAKLLTEAGYEVVRLHGDRTQNQRSKAIAALRDESARILVATDIAARGIDIPHIQHVINYDLPIEEEDYIHRIGRTARAGGKGHSLSIVIPEEVKHWARIYKMIHGRYPEEVLKMRKGKPAPTRTGHSQKEKPAANAPKREHGKKGKPAKGPATQKWLKTDGSSAKGTGKNQAKSSARDERPQNRAERRKNQFKKNSSPRRGR